MNIIDNGTADHAIIKPDGMSILRMLAEVKTPTLAAFNKNMDWKDYQPDIVGIGPEDTIDGPEGIYCVEHSSLIAIGYKAHEWRTIKGMYKELQPCFDVYEVTEDGDEYLIAEDMDNLSDAVWVIRERELRQKYHDNLCAAYTLEAMKEGF